MAVIANFVFTRLREAEAVGKILFLIMCEEAMETEGSEDSWLGRVQGEGGKNLLSWDKGQIRHFSHLKEKECMQVN